MLIETFYLDRFRKLSELRLEFAQGVNVLIGANAQGKTTVLEALYFLMTGRSFRTSRLQELYQMGKHRFDLAVDFVKEGSPGRLTVSVEPSSKQVTYLGNHSTSLSVLPGILMGSVMTPDDSHLIKGSPQSRREFLDVQIAGTDPLYGWHLGRYQRAMRQRNALLKSKNLSTCESWEHEMAVSAAYVSRARKQALIFLERHFQERYEKLQSSGEVVGIGLLSHGEEEEFYQQQWSRCRSKDMMLGFTTIGPHKDDLEILIQNKPAKAFASEGQKQTLLSALKLAEWHRLYEVAGEKPLFMIDDVGLSLDKTRREKLFEEISLMGQVFLTTTDPRDFPLSQATLHQF